MAILDTDQFKSFIREGEEGYEAPMGQLGMVDPGIRYDPRQHSYASDLYQYYLGGGQGIPSSRGAGDVTPSGTAAQVPGTTAQGTGGGGIETILSPGPALPDLGGAQNPLTQMITTPTGETMTVKEAMTRDPAYTGTVADPSGVTTAIAPPGILNPEQIELENIARAQAATDPRYAAAVAPTTVDGVPIQGRQNVTGDITDYIDPIDLDVTSLSPGVAATPAALSAAQLAKNAAGNWLYKGAAPGAKVAAQTAAKVTPWGQVGQAIKKEGAFGYKGKPGGFGSVNVGFDPKYTGKGATGLGGYITGGAKSVVGLPAAGNIAGGTPAQRLAFEKLLQSGTARGIGTLGRFAG